MLISVLASLLLTGQVAPQEGQPSAIAPPQQQAAAHGEPSADERRQAERSRVTCRRETVMGSNRQRRVCSSDAGRAERREKVQQDLERRLDYGTNPE